MTAQSPAFLACLAVVFRNEGILANDPYDPGGLTKYGISKAAYPNLDIANLTMADAQAIYLARYWEPIKADDFPPMLAMLLLDAAVNNGVERASQWLQNLAGVTQDGDIGPITIAAVNAALAKTTLPAFCTDYLALRLRFMAALPEWPHEAGWAPRLVALPFDAMAIQTQLGG